MTPPGVLGPEVRHHPSDRVTVVGCAVDRVDRTAALARCIAAVEAGRRGAAPPLQVVTLNPEILMLARRHPQLAAVIRRAALVIPDGHGLVWASRRLGDPLPARVAGVDLLDDLAAAAVDRGWRVFLLGAAPGVAAAAAERLRTRHPGLAIVGTASGSAGAAAAPLVAAIADLRPDLLAVAFGAPRQELWLDRHLAATGAALGIGVGGSLDVVAGRVPRAPQLLRDHGLEWSYRLARQPWRLPRMLRAAPFFLRVLAETRR